MPDILLTLNSQTFIAQLHTTFKVDTGDQTSITLELVSVNEPPAAPGLELFSLLFRGPRAPMLTQRIHHFAHEKIGTCDLFVTPVAADEAGVSYEVIFHRLHKKQS